MDLSFLDLLNHPLNSQSPYRRRKVTTNPAIAGSNQEETKSNQENLDTYTSNDVYIEDTSDWV